MQLLSKNEIERVKSTETRKAIDEGLKIAKATDALHKAKSEAEASLEKFRKETVSNVKKEIEDLIARRTSLQNEISIAQEELKVLKQPLDDGWEKIKTRNKHLSETENELTDRATYLSRIEHNLQERSDGLDQRERLLIYTKEKIDSNLSKSEEKLAETTLALDNAKNKENLANLKLTTAEKEIRHKEADIAAQLIDIQNREARIKARQKAQDDRDRYLNDKYETLQRTIKELNNKHGLTFSDS